MYFLSESFLVWHVIVKRSKQPPVLRRPHQGLFPMGSVLLGTYKPVDHTRGQARNPSTVRLRSIQRPSMMLSLVSRKHQEQPGTPSGTTLKNGPFARQIGSHLGTSMTLHHGSRDILD